MSLRISFLLSSRNIKIGVKIGPLLKIKKQGEKQLLHYGKKKKINGTILLVSVFLIWEN